MLTNTELTLPQAHKNPITKLPTLQLDKNANNIEYANT